MKIRTTANIDKDILKKISDAAEFLNIDIQLIVDILLKILIKEKPLKFRMFRTVEYQKRQNKDRWRCFHLELSGSVYESSIDMRKLMKLSVSYLLSYAVEEYLEKAVEEILGGVTENNYPENYSIFTHHSPEKSTFTIFHTVSNPEDYPDHQRFST